MLKDTLPCQLLHELLCSRPRLEGLKTSFYLTCVELRDTMIRNVLGVSMSAPLPFPILSRPGNLSPNLAVKLDKIVIVLVLLFLQHEIGYFSIAIYTYIVFKLCVHPLLSSSCKLVRIYLG